MKKLIFAGIASLAILAGACSDIDDNQDDNIFVVCPGFGDEPWQDARPLKEIASDNIGKSTDFASSLFKTVYSGENGNVCVSPLSVFSTFAMMANGDSGESRNEILGILGYDKSPGGLHELNVYCNALMTEVPMLNGESQCGFTNSLWYHPDLRLQSDFAADIRMIFGASLFPIYLGDESGRIKINEFVSAHTNGMIPEFLSSPIEVRLAFLNTTYFKAQWKTEFDSKLTSKGVFRNLDGSRSEAQFMYMQDELTYCQADGIRGVCLPYSGDRYTMTLLQPENETGFDFMLDNLDAGTLKKLDASASREDVALRLPKFETEINISMLDYLRKIGFNNVCSRGIDKAADEKLYLTQFIHAVKIIVDEDGTEGAAASLAGMDNAAGPGLGIAFDRPFVYIIRDTISDAILFIGTVTAF
ncbi:MAG: serpin family protein [Muribaculaceae bacterium]|nr:serpin family protein [Muribaculaceae bacterium]